MANTTKIETLSASNILGEATWDITLFKHTEKGRNDLIAPHKHDFYLVFFVENGGGIHDIDFKTHNVDDYQVYFLRPQQVHYWMLEQETVGYQMMFSSMILKTLNATYSALPFFQLGAPNCLQLKKASYEKYKAQLEALEKSLKGKKVLDKEISLLSFHLLLKYLQKDYLAAYSDIDWNTMDKSILAFEELIEKNFRVHSNVAFYAEELKITANYLNILCKKYLGITASSLIMDRILLEAKRLLTTTNVSVKEIAFSLSFNDTSYFNNFFRRQMGVTPGEFRTNYKNYNKEE
ncbi:AraC family transcriptional regulator [Myroides phaeus]|uniref:AraC family transcriptional regulator n=1 Tax=Myroides phaeus TaxID=702745 RepID=UPI001303809B|nr:AraC family transcriptional regulator [Myroides phaeus]